MKKRLTALLLTAALLCAAAPAAFAADASAEDGLSFDENGEFTLLLLADTQDVADPQKAMLALESACLDAAAPDLVVFLGDQLHGPALGNSERAAAQGISAILAPVEARGLPFALVFGNHDSEASQFLGGAFGHGDGNGGVSRTAQLAMYQQHSGCLASAGPSEITGCGNYVLTLAGADGKPAAALWFFDSGSYLSSEDSGYAAVAPDQLNWYRAQSNALAAQNGGAPVPGYVFQHIIVPEIYNALTETTADDPDAVEGQVGWSGRWFKLNESFTQGTLGEGPCPPNASSGEFAAGKEQGDIRAAFFGHDHSNSFAGTYEGIDLVAAPGVGFYIYGGGAQHGARVVTLRADGSYSTSLLFYADVLDAPLPGGLVSTMGALAQQVILGAAAVLLAVLALVALLLVRLVRRRRKKAAVPTADA